MVRNEYNIEVNTLRCDKSGENNKRREYVKADKDLKIKFEFTAPDTPQHNGQIERQFQTLYGKIRSMLNWA
jgi:hypothetical protein